MKIEELKNQKLVKEWRQRKQGYEQQISQLQVNTAEKTTVLEKLEGELKEMRDKVQYFYDSYKAKEIENDEAQKLLKDL